MPTGNYNKNGPVIGPRVIYTSSGCNVSTRVCNLPSGLSPLGQITNPRAAVTTLILCKFTRANYMGAIFYSKGCVVVVVRPPLAKNNVSATAGWGCPPG